MFPPEQDFCPLGPYERSSEYRCEIRRPSRRTDCFRHPFHAQLDDLNQSRAGPNHQQNAGEPQSFDLRQMASALPTNSEQISLEGRHPSGQYSAAGMMGPTSYQYPQHMAQYGQQRHDPTTYARTQQQQQQHYVQHQMVPQVAQYQYANRPHALQMQTQPPFGRVDPYSFGVSPSNYSPVDMRFPQQAFTMGYNPAAGFPDMSRSRIRFSASDGR